MMGGRSWGLGTQVPARGGAPRSGVAGASPARRYGMWEGPVPRVRGCVPGQVFSGVPLSGAIVRLLRVSSSHSWYRPSSQTGTGSQVKVAPL